MAKHHGLYDESPSIKHDEAGHTKVEKAKKHDSAGKEEKGVQAEGFPVHARHAHERNMMHTKHEMEHSIHDASKAGHKGELHGKHMKEHKEMLTRHEKEAGETAGSHDQGAPIEKIEKGAKG